MRRWIVALLIGLGLLGIPVASATDYPTMPQGVQGPFLVTKVVDGDTIWVDDNGTRLKVRLIGMDTPEVVDPRKPVQCFGRKPRPRPRPSWVARRCTWRPTQPGHPRQVRSHAGICLDRVGPVVQPRHDRRRLCA